MNNLQDKTQVDTPTPTPTPSDKTQVIESPSKRKLIIQIIIIVASIILAISYYFEGQEKRPPVQTKLIHPKKKLIPKKKQMLPEGPVNEKIKEELKDVAIPNIPEPVSVIPKPKVEDKPQKTDAEFLQEHAQVEQLPRSEAPVAEPIPSATPSVAEEIKQTPVIVETTMVESILDKMNYTQLGRGLVYNCEGLHYACISRREFALCQTYFAKDKSCIPLQIYQTHHYCTLAQLEKIDSATEQACGTLKNE